MGDNRLGHETSPYLLQHKDKPVNWRPWGPEALAEAQRVFRVMDGVLDLVPALSETDEQLALWVEERLEARKAARAVRDFAAADVIRAEPVSRGIEIEDSADGTKWRAV